MERILRYIKGTLDYGIQYRKGSEQLLGYSDASWANDLDDRKSVSGNIFMLSGAPISWRSKKQTPVALSTAEAEYVALDERLTKIGFAQHKEDLCQYTATGGETAIVAVYVDDIMTATE